MSVRKISTASILSPAYKNSKIWDGETFPGNFESIATIIVANTSTASVTFSDIPTTYTHLQLRSVHQEPTDSIEIQPNSINSNVYTNHSLLGDGSTATSAYTSQGLSIYGIVIGTNYGSNGDNFGVSITDFLDYANTSKYKVIRSITGASNNTTFSRVGIYGGMYFSTTAITSIKIFPRTTGYNFAKYTQFCLYGIRT